MNIDTSNISIIHTRYKGCVYDINIKDMVNIKNNMTCEDLIDSVEDYLDLDDNTFDSYEIYVNKTTNDLVIKPRSKFM
jgi:hypothetical protein